jgi:hypothetical protein
MTARLWPLLCCVLAAPLQAQTSVAANPAPAPNPFAPLSWQAPAPAPAQPVAAPVAPAPPVRPPAPLAPPLPFKYLGRYTAGVALVVLTIGERMIVAKAGDTLEGTWRIDRTGPALIEFTYLPLQLKRSLATGDAN